MAAAYFDTDQPPATREYEQGEDHYRGSDRRTSYRLSAGGWLAGEGVGRVGAYATKSLIQIVG